jgi:hypothetical protein
MAARCPNHNHLLLTVQLLLLRQQQCS